MPVLNERAKRLALAILRECTEASKVDEELTLGDCLAALDATQTQLTLALHRSIWDKAFGDIPALRDLRP